MKRLFSVLSSRSLTITRWLVLAWMLLSIGLVIYSLPVYFNKIYFLNPGVNLGDSFNGWTAIQIQAVSAKLSVNPTTIAITRLVASLVCLLCFWGVGGLLFWRKSDTWIGLLAAFILFATGPGFSSLQLTQSQAAVWVKNIFSFMAVFTWPTFFIFFYLFPNGKFVPRFVRYLAPLPYIVFILVRLIETRPGIESLALGILILYALGGLISQIYRYHRFSTPEERQQTKWVVYALGVFLGALIVTLLTPVIFSSRWIGTSLGFWNEFIGNGVIGILLPALIPLSLGISILRYRLWDIDVVIRRTLVYGGLTAALALVFFGGVTLLQRLFTALSGQQSAISIVVSTLAIAALFNPLRRRIQNGIDRRFYRKKYNAEKALARFAVTAQNETDIEELSADLVSVVQETIQPDGVTLWLIRG